MRNPHRLVDGEGSDQLGGDPVPPTKSTLEYQRLPGKLGLRFDAPGPILTRHYLRPADMEARP